MQIVQSKVGGGALTVALSVMLLLLALAAHPVATWADDESTGDATTYVESAAGLPGDETDGLADATDEPGNVAVSDEAGDVTPLAGASDEPVGDETSARISEDAGGVDVAAATSEGLGEESAPSGTAGDSGAQTSAAETAGDMGASTSAAERDQDAGESALAVSASTSEGATEGAPVAETTEDASEEAVAEDAAAASGLLAQGTWGTCSWSVSTKGLLKIWPTNGKDGVIQDSPRPWQEWCSKITSIQFVETVHVFDVSNPESFSETERGSLEFFFSGYPRLTSIDLSGFDTAGVHNMSSMFAGCDRLTSIDLSDLDTSRVTEMQHTFSKCKRLTSLDLSGLDTSRVVHMDGLCEFCDALASVDLEGIDTSSLKTMTGMFYECHALTTVDLTEFDASGVEYMSYLFYLCDSLSTIDLSEFDTSSVIKMDEMFGECRLNRIDVGPSCIFKKGVFPQPRSFTSNGRWLSMREGDWFTRQTIESERNGTIDTYTSGDIALDGCKPVAIKLAKVTVANQTYTGTARKPAPKVTMGDLTLRPGVDYSVSYKNNVKAGTANVILTGKGDYAGTLSKKFTIKPASLAKAKVKLGTTSYVFDEKAKKPAVKSVTMTLGGKTVTLKAGTDYTVSYKNNVNAGTATVVVTGRGNYSGTAKATFTIRYKDRWERLAGANAVATMQAIVRADGVFTPSTVDTVVVAGRRDFKAALAGTGLAGLYQAPLLITDPNSRTLSGPAKAELLRLKPKRVIVVGDTSVVPALHFDQIRANAPKARVTRVAGSSASGTALAIHRAGESAPVTWGKTCVIATQAAFKDAMSIAPYAYAKHAPIFFTESTRIGDGKGLSDATEAAIKWGGFTRVLIVGGNLAVPDSVYRQLPGMTIRRLAGATAIGTSKAIAQFELGEGMNRKHLAVATTQDFADALAGAALAGAEGSVLVLANQTGGYAAFDAIYRSSELVHGHILGGPLALSAASETYFRKK